MSRPRPVDVARGALGALALVRPDLVLRPTGAPADRVTRRTVRVLGARYVVQSAGGLALGRPWVPVADASVDLVHAATMLGLAAVSPGHRRAALASAGTAVAFAAADLTEQRR